MKSSCIATALCLLCLTASTFAGDKKKPLADPTPRRDAILKLFVEEFVPITPGKGKFPKSFKMGTEGKAGRDNERPVREVTFAYDFAIAKYEVTQELYQVVMGANPAQFQGLRNGMDRVNWKEANEFGERVTKLLRERKLIAADERIRLPSEAEWEYCCRAGTTTKWSFGDDVKEIGAYSWYKDNSAKEDPPVGMRKPNPWGLYDMHGYVWEWCLDAWSPSYKNAPTDGSAHTDKNATDYVVRGGAYPDPAEAQRSAYRHFVPADTKSGAIGFRCVKEKGMVLKMSKGGAVVIRNDKLARRITNNRPDVIDIAPTRGDAMLLMGVGVGIARIMVLFMDGEQLFLEVHVSLGNVKE